MQRELKPCPREKNCHCAVCMAAFYRWLHNRATKIIRRADA